MCEKCDNGWLIDESKSTAKYCDCVLQESIKRNQKILMGKSGQDIFKTFEKRKDQIKILELIKDDSSMWLYGETGAGKSFMSARAINKYILSSSNPNLWGWYEAIELINIWKDLYSDDRNESLAEIKKIKKNNVLSLNDIDKINTSGKITSERESQIFSLIDSFKGQLIITSQYDIRSFCELMPSESIIIERDGIGPIERRIREKCVEVRI